MTTVFGTLCRRSYLQASLPRSGCLSPSYSNCQSLVIDHVGPTVFTPRCSFPPAASCSMRNGRNKHSAISRLQCPHHRHSLSGTALPTSHHSHISECRKARCACHHTHAPTTLNVPCCIEVAVRRSPFAVRRSPFAVRRSQFAVHRSPFAVHRCLFVVVVVTSQPPAQFISF